MRTIGFFSREGDGFDGHIATLTIQHKAVILPNLNRRRKDVPDFQVFANGVLIGEARFPSATSEKCFLSVTLDDPSFAAAMPCCLIDEGFGTYRLVWSR